MLASFALLASLAQAPATDVVRIDVIARDARGRAVETLTAADFEIREDGTPQAVVDAPLVRKPRLIGIYLDEYYVGPSQTASVKAALHRFVDDLAPDDQVAILRPLDSLLTIKLTSDRALLYRVIDAFEGRRGDYIPRTELERSLLAGDRARADVQRAQSTWSTLNALTLHLANLRAGRSSVLLVSEQADSIARRRGFETLPTSSSITRTANRSNVSVYVWDPRGAAERESAPDEGPNLLRVLADDTDGALMAGPESVDAGLKQMLGDAASYYLVSYRSARGRDGLFHSVEVGVKRKGVSVRARKGFLAPTVEEIQRAELLARAKDPLPPIKLEPPRHASTLIRPWFGIARGDNGKVRMTFVWEPSGAVPGDRRVKVPARLEVKAVGADGKTAYEGTVSDRSAAVFDVPPGRLTLTSSVQDSASQPIDSDLRDVIVRDLRGPVVLGTPEVFRARTARDVREINEEKSPVPVAAREFSRAEHLLIRVPAYAPSQQPAMLSATLVSPARQPMRQLSVEQATATQPLAQIDLPLAGLPPGQYAVEIAAKASAGIAKDTVVFRVSN
jgi:Ca-activated chloride channel homolog